MLGLQGKLKVNEPGDIYEQEADRIADQVMSSPVHFAARSAPLNIQRLTRTSNGQMDAPASVARALASPARPLEPTLRQDMEQRFGHDFSRVRVSADGAAQQSAREMHANAYTVGHNIVFGAGFFAPETHEGRRLIAHELTHVVQQSGATGQLGASSGARSTASPYVARKNGPAPVRAPARRPPPPVSSQRPGPARRHLKVVTKPPQLWQQVNPPQTVSPPGIRPQYPTTRSTQLVPQPQQAFDELQTACPKIAIATFAPGRGAVLQDVSWRGPWGGKFDKEGTRALKGDEESFAFAILQPPSDLYHDGYGWVSIEIKTETTWDGYMVPVVSDLSAALVVPLDKYTDAVFRSDGSPLIKGRFLAADFEGAYWVPIKNIKIMGAPAGGVVVLSREAEEERAWRQLAKDISEAGNPFRPTAQPIREIPKPEPQLLRFSDTGKEVTIDRLSAWAERTYPHGVDYASVLAALRSSQGFSFSGPEDARTMAAAALVLELRETTRAKRRRGRKCARVPGPVCPIWHPRLTQPNPYWNHAFNYRRSEQMLMPRDFNQNIAVLLLDGGRTVIKPNGMLHSEAEILLTLAKRGIESDLDCPIIGLFSERKPCQQICQKDILPRLCRINKLAATLSDK